MNKTTQSWLVPRVLFNPSTVFAELSETRPSAYFVFFRFMIWLAVLPPLFAYIGASKFGWHLGGAMPLRMDPGDLLKVSVGYFVLLLSGLVGTAIVSQWMAGTYGARHSLGIHFAMVTVVAAPLAIGSVIHLYPHVFINVVVLIPVLMWSMYLLYKGLPVVLKTSPEQGILMASSMIGWLLVAAVSLLGITVALWARGIGPSIGV